MSASAVVFYILSFFILGTGLLAVTSRKIFRSAIWLLFSLTGIAGLYFWLQMEFIAAVQIVVYVGGIVVLIIFSIFLTQKAGDEMPQPRRSRTIFSVLSVLLGFAFSFLLFAGHEILLNQFWQNASVFLTFRPGRWASSHRAIFLYSCGRSTHG